MKKAKRKGSAPKSRGRVRAEEAFVIDVMEVVAGVLEKSAISRSELARRMDVSRSYVTQMLRGRNITLRTLAAVMWALDAKPEFRARAA